MIVFIFYPNGEEVIYKNCAQVWRETGRILFTDADGTQRDTTLPYMVITNEKTTPE